MNMLSSLASSFSSQTSTIPCFNSLCFTSRTNKPKKICWNSFSRFEMSVNAKELPRLPEHRILVGCGTVTTDYLATVAAFPQPDEKTRSLALKVQGGGNVGNALTGAARLGLIPRLISKVSDDPPGRRILAEFQEDGVDTSYVVVSDTGNSPLTYVIVDIQTKTRTCIHSPGSPPMALEDIPQSKLISALTGAALVYFDGRLPYTALRLAKQAKQMKLPLFVDAERKREGLDELLLMADYVVCSAKFPKAWTEAPSIADALVAMCVRLPSLKFVIVTLGEEGCIMLEQMLGSTQGSSSKVNDTLESLRVKVKEIYSAQPTTVSSEVGVLQAPGIGEVYGRLIVGTAEYIAATELVDTTGAGDGFISAVLYAIVCGMPAERMLPFAATVASANCRALGARSGLPRRDDPRLLPYLSGS